MDFGTRIKELREASGISQSELARLAEIAQSGLSYLETGSKSPNADTLLRICKALGITLAEFFGEEVTDVPPDLRQLLHEAKKLTPEQRKKLIEFIRSISD